MKPNLESILRTIILTRVSILLGLVADYNISVAGCSPLDSFDITGDDASALRFDSLSEMFNENDGKDVVGTGKRHLSARIRLRS